MRKLELIAFAAATVVLATPAAAQGRGHGNDGVPPGQRPPAGMCRIWIDGVPPGQQPAPTSCALAESRRPANARVIYGDETAFPGHGRRDASNGRVVTVDGRRCVERVDAQGNATYDCPTSTQNGGIFSDILRGRGGRTVDESGQVVNRRGDDEDDDERIERGDRHDGDEHMDRGDRHEDDERIDREDRHENHGHANRGKGHRKHGRGHGGD